MCESGRCTTTRASTLRQSRAANVRLIRATKHDTADDRKRAARLQTLPWQRARARNAPAPPTQLSGGRRAIDDTNSPAAVAPRVANLAPFLHFPSALTPHVGCCRRAAGVRGSTVRGWAPAGGCARSGQHAHTETPAALRCSQLISCQRVM